MRARIKLLAMLGLCAVSSAAATEWHLPSPYPDTEHHTRNLRAFADEVREATDGELVITIHSAASLFRHADIHHAVRSGQVPAGEMLMGMLGNENPLFKVDNIPFLATDFAAAERLWKASRPHLERELDKQGLMLLYAVPWPPQGLYAKRAIDSVAQLEGMKLRAYSPLTSRLSVLLGATPVNVQAPEIAQAFSTGMIDAMITSPSTGVSSQAWDFVDHYIDIQAWIPKNMVIVNKRAFRRLPAPHREAVLAAARRAETRGWQMAQEETKRKTAELAKHGMLVSPPSDQLREELTAIGRQLTEEWLRETGDAGREILEATGR